MNTDSDDILRALESPDEENRRRALFWVAQKRDVRALFVLKRMAQNDPSVEVRYYAKKALLFFQQLPSPPPASEGTQSSSFEGLRDPQAKVRNETVQALARSGTEGALEAFSELVGSEKNPFVKATLAVAIGVLGSTPQIPLLDRFLADADPRVRANAIEGLMHIGGPEVSQRIVPHLKDTDKRVKVNAYTALSKVKKIDLLKALGEMLTAEKLWVRDASAYALAKLLLPESVPLLQHALADGYVGVRLKARNGLVSLSERGVTQAGVALERVGGERSGPKAYLTLGMLKLRERTAAGPLNDQEGRLALIRRIVQAHDKEKLGMLIRQLGREKHPKVIATLLAAVGRLGHSGALKALMPFLDSTDRRIRANAVEAIGLLANDEDLGVLEVFALDPDNRVRGNAIVALGNAGLDCSKAIQDMARAPDELMRLSAIYALVELGRLEQLSILETLLEDPLPRVRKKAVDGLRILASDGMAPAGQLLRQAGLSEQADFQELS